METITKKQPIELTGKETKDQIINLLVAAGPNFENLQQWDQYWYFKKDSKPELLTLAKIYNANIENGGTGNLSRFYNPEAYTYKHLVDEYTEENYGSIMDKMDYSTKTKLTEQWKEFVKTVNGFIGKNDIEAAKREIDKIFSPYK